MRAVAGRLGVSLAITLAVGARVTWAQARYTITVSDTHPRVVRVEAEFRLRDPLLRMTDEAFPDLPDGWATFVRDVELRGAEGQSLGLERTGPATWKAQRGIGREAVLRYQVVVQHDDTLPDGRPRYAWDRALSTVAYAKPWGVLLTGRAVFLLGDWMRDIRVTVALPPGWRVSASWAEAPGAPATFVAPTAASLWEGLLMAGAINPRREHIAGLDVEFALGGERMGADADHVVSLTTRALEYYRHVFGGFPEQSLGLPYRKILVVVNQEPRRRYWGGGLIGKDLSLLLPDSDSLSRPIRDAVMTHELFHLWNGRSFRYRTAAEAWFSEGATEYYAFRALRAIGEVDDAAFLAHIAEAYERYLADSGVGHLSPVQASEQIPEHHAMVYDGGFLLSLCFDTWMRYDTGNASGFDDVMRALFHKFDSTAHRYDTGDVRAAIATALHRDHGRLFAGFVLGRTPVNLAECLAPAALGVMPQPDGGFRIVEQPASPLERLIQDGVLARPQ